MPKNRIDMSSKLVREGTAEFVGTAILVFLAVGSAVFGIDTIGAVGVAFAFGLTLLALAYAIGPVSGCHVNPAVTLGVLLTRGIDARQALVYWTAQVTGGIAGAALLFLLVQAGGVTDNTGALGTNGWGPNINAFGGFLVETLLTLVLVLVVLLTTARAAAPGFAGLAIGVVLTVIHLVAIPLTGTSVNPARSIGPALFGGVEALAHLWLFIIAPLLGGLLAALLAPALYARPAAKDDSDPTDSEVPGTGTTPRRRA
jgi:aquaporin Z